MRSIQYNPANDGYAAKTWECLRRNTTFREMIVSFRKDLSSNRTPDVRRLAKQSPDRSLVAAQILSAVAGWPVAKQTRSSPSLTSRQGLIEDTVWPNLPELLRITISMSADADLARIRRLNPPPCDSTGDSFLYGNTIQRETFREWLASLPQDATEFVIVAIPKLVRDTIRRKKCKEELMKFLPKASLNAKKLKTEGSALGSRRDWEIYLFVEQRLKNGASRLSAWDDAARNFYPGEAREMAHLPKIAIKAFNRVQSRRRHLIEQRVRSIEEAVKASFS